MAHMIYDVMIIGAGVVGGNIARELARYDLKVLVVDKENDVSCGASKANSGIVHGGYDDRNGSVKARFSRAGNQMYDQLEKELNFGFSRCGSLVIAFDDQELDALKRLKENGELNGVLDLSIIGREEILALEPHINPEVQFALYCPSAGIVSPYEFTIALFENAVANGLSLRLNSQVMGIEKAPDGVFEVTTATGLYHARFLINAAGVYSDLIAGFLNADSFKITPRKGDYILLSKTQGTLANGVIFQTPSENGKGILVTRTYHGNLMLGPNAQLVDDKDDTATTTTHLASIARTARRSIPNFNLKAQIRTFSGLRATSDRHDFIIEESVVPRFINVAGIESPGLTASPAIAKYVCDLLQRAGLALRIKENFNPYRKPIIVRKSESFEGSIDASLPSMNIICRCEKVTEAEILDALGRGLPVADLDGLKRRTRARMGPCQGKFCTPRLEALTGLTVPSKP